MSGTYHLPSSSDEEVSERSNRWVGLFLLLALVFASMVLGDARLQQAQQQLRSGNVPAAIEILEGFRDQKPPHLEALSLLAALYMEAGRAEDTLAILEPVIDANADPRTLFHAARAAMALGRVEQGEEYLERSVAKAPTSFAAVRLAELRAVQERSDEVIQILSPLAEGTLGAQVVQQDPGLAARIAWLFGRALVAEREYKRAAEPLERLSRLQSEDQAVWKLYGETLIELDRIDEAQIALTRAHELGEAAHQASVDAEADQKRAQQEGEVLLRRAVEAYRGQRLGEALTALQQAIVILPEDPRPRTLEVRLLSELKREKEALPKAEALVELLPEDPEPIFLRGMVKLGLEDLSGAESDLRQVLDREPEHLGGMNGLAMTLMLTERLEEAKALLQRLLKRWPEDPVARRNLAKIEAGV